MLDLPLLYPSTLAKCRYDLKDKSQLKRLEEVERLVSEFGPTNPSFIYSVMLPKVEIQKSLEKSALFVT